MERWNKILQVLRYVSRVATDLHVARLSQMPSQFHPSSTDSALLEVLSLPNFPRGLARMQHRRCRSCHRPSKILFNSMPSSRSTSRRSLLSTTSNGSFKRPQLPHRKHQYNKRPTTTSRPLSSAQSTSSIHSKDFGNDHVDGDDTLDHIVMAIDVKQKGTIGCAYYVAREEALFCMEDLSNGAADDIERLKMDFQPTVFIVSPSTESLKEHGGIGFGVDSDALPTPYQVDLRPAAEFGYDSAVNKLSRLSAFSNVGCRFLVPGNTTYDEDHPDEIGLNNWKGQVIQLSTYLNLDSRVSIGCAGAVLNHLQRRRTSEYLQDDPAAQLAYRVYSVEIFTLRNNLLMNTDALASLQIIQPESHPNAFNQGPGVSGSKESLSLYGLFHHNARTPHGKSRLRQLFLRPTMGVDEINSRLDVISVFIRPDNQPLLHRLSNSLSKIKNMKTTMTCLHKGVDGRRNFKSGVWASLLEFCYHSIDIVETLREVSGELPIRVRATEILDRFHLQRIGRMVHDVVDLELSAEQSRTVVKRGVNENLDTIKDVYDGMDEILSRTAIEIARTMIADVALNVIYFPQLGFHITIPVGAPANDDWERVFSTNNQNYFKNAKMREMDQELGDLYATICDMEIELAHNLAQRVLEDEELLISASELCGELDCMLALTHGAIEHKLTRPKFGDIIEINGGRHLLHEMTVPSFVPNDTYLKHMLILTGPNFSGKSVYQKQVALIVYLAHIGSFVPAESATVSVTDKILTRISTRETVSKIQSAFMIDVQQIATALKACTPQSLIIIDEFGKGTDSCDGAGLAMGVFAHLLALGDKCPKVLAATHFHEIFDLGILDNNDDDDDGSAATSNTAIVEFAHMEVQTVGNGDITYLYNLREGRSDLSYGTQCAAMNGIPDQIVQRAMQLGDYMAQGEDLVAVCSAVSEQEERELEHAEKVARGFLRLKFDDGDDDDDLFEALRLVLGDD